MHLHLMLNIFGNNANKRIFMLSLFFTENSFDILYSLHEMSKPILCEK